SSPIAFSHLASVTMFRMPPLLFEYLAKASIAFRVLSSITCSPPEGLPLEPRTGRRQRPSPLGPWRGTDPTSSGCRPTPAICPTDPPSGCPSQTPRPVAPRSRRRYGRTEAAANRQEPQQHANTPTGQCRTPRTLTGEGYRGVCSLL